MLCDVKSASIICVGVYTSYHFIHASFSLRPRVENDFRIIKQKSTHDTFNLKVNIMNTKLKCRSMDKVQVA